VSYTNNTRQGRSQTVLAIATVVAYAVGYPVAIFAHSIIGWVLVMVGGVFLLLFLLATIRRVHRGA
jgi:hypothetical protein